MSNDLLWLLNWQYLLNKKEYENSISFFNLDNPGWELEVNLLNTDLKDEIFSRVDVDRTETDWTQCFTKDGIFQGAGGPLNLMEILHIFRTWVEGITEKKTDPKTKVNPGKLEEINYFDHPNFANIQCDQMLVWLQNWFQSQCNGAWEHGNGVEFWTTQDFGVRINIQTGLSVNKPFADLSLNQSKSDWLHCYVENMTFDGGSSPNNLPILLSIFKEWLEGVDDTRNLIEAKHSHEGWIVQSFHGYGDKHWNKVTKKDVPTPHMHDSTTPGGVRAALDWEIPKTTRKTDE